MTPTITVRLHNADHVYAEATAILTEHGIHLDPEASRQLRFLAAVGPSAVAGPVVKLCEAVGVAA